MRRSKEYDFDREKKLHKVVKSNKVDKHKKNIYNVIDVDYEDDFDEKFLDEVESSTNTQ